MIQTYFKAAIRNLRKNKGFSILNISGLAVGIACASFILLWVEDELNYDRSFARHDTLYRVMENQVHDGAIISMDATPGPLAPAIKTEIPGIVNAARTTNNNQLAELFGLGDKVLNEQGNYADSGLFTILGLDFVHGEASRAFDQVHSLVISETMSEQFFGKADPVGRTLKVNNKDDYRISGVFRDLPANSTIHFQWLAPFENFEQMVGWVKNWDANGVGTYVELQPNADVKAIDRQLQHYLRSKKEEVKTECWLFPMNDWHLYRHFTNGREDGKGQIKYLRLFFLIGCIILFIACINFMNLSTAKSAERAREVGVRKVIGAGRGGLVRQFIGESLLFSYIAVILAVGIVYAAMPAFNALVGKQLVPAVFSALHLGVVVLIGLITGLIAGSYPAFYLSSFQPIVVLKRMKLQTSGGAAFVRKGLVVVQFSISILLIICTAIIYQQVNYTRYRDWGFEKDNLLSMKVQGTMQPHFEALRADLIRTGVVENAALSMGDILQLGWWSMDGYQWPGKVPGKNVDINNEQVTASFIKTAGMRLKEGRGFLSDTHAEDNNIIINESMARLMGSYAKPGNVIYMGTRALHIIGILHDFVFDDVYSKSASPLVMYGEPDAANVMTIRLRKGVELSGALKQVGAVMQKGNPGYPFEYRFVDDHFDQLFKTETLTGRLAGIFSILAVFISCLGLFGLAAYSAARRSKEIGIRKVLGASPRMLAALLSGDFLKWVVVSCVLAFPLAWAAMNAWLRDYEYRTAIHWWVFALAGGGALLIALGTVSFQAIRAALASPVKSLAAE
jgi:putative ABC transport system permease protein